MLRKKKVTEAMVAPGTRVRATEDLPLDWVGLREPDIVEGTLVVFEVGPGYTQYIVGGIPVVPESIAPLPPTDEVDARGSALDVDDAT